MQFLTFGSNRKFKKRHFILLILVVVMLLVWAYIISLFYISSWRMRSLQSFEGVTVTTEVILNANGEQVLRVHMVNNTDVRFTYGRSFVLYTRSFFNWRDLRFPRGMVFQFMGYDLHPEAYTVRYINLYSSFGTLPRGQYRFTTQVRPRGGNFGRPNQEITVVGSFRV